MMKLIKNKYICEDSAWFSIAPNEVQAWAVRALNLSSLDFRRKYPSQLVEYAGISKSQFINLNFFNLVFFSCYLHLLLS